jgi:S1-C subfamily serine protease
VYPLEVAKVASALGGARVLGVPPGSFGAMSEAITRGFPRDVVTEVAAQAAPDGGDLRRKVAALIVSPATYKRGWRGSPRWRSRRWGTPTRLGPR